MFATRVAKPQANADTQTGKPASHRLMHADHRPDHDESAQALTHWRRNSNKAILQQLVDRASNVAKNDEHHDRTPVPHPAATPQRPHGADATPKHPPDAGAPPAPIAVIGAITFLGSPNRVAPTRTATVAVSISNLPAGASTTLDVEGSGGANGTATVASGAKLHGPGTVTVRGGKQTSPGSAGALMLRASVGAAVIGRSPGFTVAAWPTDFRTWRNNDVDDPDEVGLAVKNAWTSDGNGPEDLDEVDRAERVDIGSADNPPFTSEVGTSATTGTSGFMDGTETPKTDTHTYPRAQIATGKIAADRYSIVFVQNFVFNDRRTGVTNLVVRNSGFTIRHSAWFSGPTGDWRHQAVKTGAAVTVGGKAATAGSGTAASDVHKL